MCDACDDAPLRVGRRRRKLCLKNLRVDCIQIFQHILPHCSCAKYVRYVFTLEQIPLQLNDKKPFHPRQRQRKTVRFLNYKSFHVYTFLEMLQTPVKAVVQCNRKLYYVQPLIQIAACVQCSVHCALCIVSSGYWNKHCVKCTSAGFKMHTQMYLHCMISSTLC